MRIGVLGGTFDPPHIGHLVAAVDAYESLSLDRLIFIPAGQQPLKTDRPAAAPAKDRLEMVRRAVGGDPRFEVSEVEIERGGLSYMVDTLETLSRDNPGAKLVLILGADALATFERWRSPERIRELAEIAVLTRDAEGPRGLAASGGIGVSNRRIDVSSSEIRERVKQGKSIHGFVAESVEAYISAENLYRSATESGVSAGR